LLLFISCRFENDNSTHSFNKPTAPEYKLVNEIPLPEGYRRTDTAADSFAQWLRSIGLKKDKQVYLYDGSLKKNQTAQFAVLDIPVGKKNLQQCADAVIRLRAEYLFAEKRFSEIKFTDNAAKVYQWEGRSNSTEFENYLENVFGYCGSASLEKQLKPVDALKNIQPGDVFIRGGFPGHAMIVLDVAENDKGEKIFMLAQSYMPAQDIHIVRNPMNSGLSPWYQADETVELITPEWRFYKNQLRRWQLNKNGLSLQN
jgi:hypothetical protein